MIYFRYIWCLDDSVSGVQRRLDEVMFLCQSPLCAHSGYSHNLTATVFFEQTALRANNDLNIGVLAQWSL